MTSFGFSGVSFRVPMSWIGTALQGSAKKQFTMIRNKIDFYNICEIDSRNIVVILDLIENVKAEGYARSVPVLSEIVHYLRSLLLSSDTEVVYHTLVLLDHIVKNSGFILHVMIGRRRFMKTMGYVARKHTAEINYANKRVGNLALDCIQAWGEAFYPREEHYPHICRTYTKLKFKHKMHFPRPDFDPTRVPIFLDDVSRIEKAMAYSFNNEVELNYDRLEECKEEPREVNTAPTRARQRNIPPLKPPRSYSSETNLDIDPPESKIDASPDLIQFGASADIFPWSEPTAPSRDDNVPDRYMDTFSTHIPAPLPSASPGVAFDSDWMQSSPESAAERVMSLYPPTYSSPPSMSSSHAALSPPQSLRGALLPPAHRQVSSPPPPMQPTVQSQRPVQAVTPWDMCDSASFPAPIAGIKSTNEALRAAGSDPGWLSNFMQPTSHTSQANGNQHRGIASHNLQATPTVSSSWDMASAVDLSKLAESLPAVREKKLQAKPPLAQSVPRTAGAPRTQTLSGRLPSPRAAGSDDVVAEALAEFQLKMSSESALPAYPPPPVPTAAAPPRVPSPPPPSPATAASPPAPSNGSEQMHAPPLPPVPAPSLDHSILYEDLSPENASPSSPPRDPWTQLSFGSPPAGPSQPAFRPPPLPAFPPPTFAVPAMAPPSLVGTHKTTEESERMSTSMSTSSSEEEPIWNLIQNMDNPLQTTAASASSSVSESAIEVMNSPSRVPRLPAPMPGSARTKRSDNAPPLMHFEGNTEQQQHQQSESSQSPPLPHLQQQQKPHQRAKSAQLPTSKPLSFPCRAPSEDTGPLERFDPTAGPKPAQPKKPAEPRKVTFSPPSSDPLNEIKYYGNQRVVVRRI